MVVVVVLVVDEMKIVDVVVKLSEKKESSIFDGTLQF